MKQIDAGVLRVAYHEAGPVDGPVAVLLHGFPYDVHAYDEVVPRLLAAGWRCLVPYLRGYGPTRFLREDTLRSGEQAALGADLLCFLDALKVERAVLAGYDWGGRAACVVAALRPERVSGLVSGGPGYNIQRIAQAQRPLSPEAEYRLWYQYYLHGERGRAGLEAHREAFCRLLWQLWSPTWAFTEADYARSAEAFDNPDFVEVVVHSYRHRFALAAGDPAYAPLEKRLAGSPGISVPTVVLEGTSDGVAPPTLDDQVAVHFLGPYRRQLLPDVGHNLPQEAPQAFAEAVMAVASGLA
jgi:pimeloyl-ACP methyl ester carboxylesterase